MKKLFAALASAALVGTVFAQAGVPASAVQPKGEATKDQATVVKEKDATPPKADMKADAGKPVAKGAHHKTGKTKAAHTEHGMAKAETMNDSDKAKAKTDAAKPAAQPEAAKAAAGVDNTKKQ